MPEWARPAHAGRLDYHGREGAFVRSSFVDGATSIPNFAPPLDFYKSYNKSVFPDVWQLFDTVAAVVARLSVQNLSDCTTWPGVTQAQLRNYIDFTKDAEGLEYLDNKTLVPKCGNAGTVWRSGACRKMPGQCIPFVTYFGYRVPEAMQFFQYWEMPVAILDVSEDAWQDAGQNMRVMLYWWKPDVRFEGMSEIVAPIPNTNEHSVGLYRTALHDVLTKYMWKELSKAAPQFSNLVEAFNLNSADQDEAMTAMHRGSSARGEACAWVRRNWRRWKAWLPGECELGMELTRLGVCVSCPAGKFYTGGVCLDCAAGTYSPNPSSLGCTHCPEGVTSSHGSAGCFVPLSVAYNSWRDIGGLGGFIGLLVIVVLACACVWVRRRGGNIVRKDTPDAPDTRLGASVQRCIGKRAQSLLTRSETKKSTSVMQVAFHVRPQMRAWLVNASPFSVDVTWDDGHNHLDPHMFVLVWGGLPRELQVRVADPPWTSNLWQPQLGEATFELNMEDGPHWQKGFVRPAPDGTVHTLYDFPVMRLSLPEAEGETRHPPGEMKLTKIGDEALVISWSPPHTLRGVPIADFEVFLDGVMANDCMFDECFETRMVTQRSNTARSLALFGGLTQQHQRTPSVVPKRNRNMYHACDYMIIRDSACVDASYAELRTKHGPANIFVSHVWSQTAHNTKMAIGKLREYFSGLSEQRQEALMNNGDGDSDMVTHTEAMCSVDSFDEISKIRVWFCTLCNNQSRISEELGDDVLHSPFARVLNFSACRQAVLISPHLALERKWCNYEFCVARNSGKLVLMLTEGGVVQAGQVAPKELDELATRVMNLNCENSTCANLEDAALIDQAVEQMGGYRALNKALRGVFEEAIQEAHSWAQTALDKIRADT